MVGAGRERGAQRDVRQGMALIAQHAGGEVSVAELRSAFGNDVGDPGRVILACDAQCRLEGVQLGKPANGYRPCQESCTTLGVPAWEGCPAYTARCSGWRNVSEWECAAPQAWHSVA